MNDTVISAGGNRHLQSARRRLNIRATVRTAPGSALSRTLIKMRRAPQSFNTLQRQMSRSNYEGLYDQAKSLLCCTLADGTRDAWVAYTVASAFAGAHTR